ncbi:hypothetical protein WMW72_12265 [Paenibacillus filicis]|uniref:Uncharacterized protein n=1 Tax=Paenibacillus filicis TaxID=669464 RepID=A0ABU9DKF7_9BACL
MMDRPAIPAPPKRYILGDPNAHIGFARWYQVLTAHMAIAVKEAAKVGMPANLAERVFAETMKNVLDDAVRVSAFE